MMRFELQIESTCTPVPTLSAASAIYCQRRDASGLGMDEWLTAGVRDRVTGERFYVSYNGCVWPAGFDRVRAGALPLVLS